MQGVRSPAKRISTHLSHVLLSDTRAFKLKRAVRHSFVDFSRIERRRAACEAELLHNRHLAGALYEAVLPVTRSGDHRYGIDGRGEIVDWIVLMQRFDDSQQFDALARRGALPVSLIERLVERVAHFHATRPAVFDAGYVTDYAAVLDNIRQVEEEFAEDGGTGAPALLAARLKIELAALGGKIEQRRTQGCVRRGHGDLHLRNICMFGGVPTPFDALEFDERLATTDVLYDLAFLLMDLRRLGQAACANSATRRYWEVAGETEDGRQLLPFFMAIRAAVRMAIALEIGDPSSADVYRTHGFQLLEPPARVPEGRTRAFTRTEPARLIG
jgi:hypothetical protein